MIKILPADTAFSWCVRERADWTCERCGAAHRPPTFALHCAHWHSRGSWSTRFDPANALALCYGCHSITGQRRESEHRPLMLRIVGELQLERLSANAARPAHRIKARKAEIAKHYRGQLEILRAARVAGKVGRIDFEGWRP